MKASVRLIPVLLMLAAVVFAGNLDRSGPGQRAKGWEGDFLEKMLVAPPAVATLAGLPCPTIGELIGISEQAAALTGSLALLEKDDRPRAASGAAIQIRALQQQAVGLPGGLELAWVLGDLAEALEKYARGDPTAGPSTSSGQASGQAPLAIGDVRETSARNAGVRKVLEQQLLICGGRTDE